MEPGKWVRHGFLRNLVLESMRISYSSMPYSKIQFLAIQTPGFMELIPDSELFLQFASGFTATFEFKGDTDIGKIGRMISEYVLEK